MINLKEFSSESVKRSKWDLPAALITSKGSIIDEELKGKLKDMFMQLQTPFNKHKPTGRISFMNYSYVFYKCCEILEESDAKNSFQLFKSYKKLKEYDHFWEKMCNDLNWKFISSI